MIPETALRKFPVQLKSAEPPIVRTYSLESTVAEKLDAILDLMDLTTRMKDFFDIDFILQHYNLKSETLKTAIEATFKSRKRNYDMARFLEAMRLAEDSTMNTKWLAFLRKAKQPQVSFAEILKRIDEKLHEIMQMVFV